MQREQTTVVTSLRISERNYSYVKEKAQEIGVSQNAFMSILIDLGIKLYEGGVNVIVQPQSE